MIDPEAQRIMRLLLHYTYHSCTYHETDSPNDDVCRCKVAQAARQAREYINKKE